MKNVAHIFEPSIVESAFREIDVERQPTKKFEFIAALVMHRVYEHQWNEPTMIGFFLTQRAVDALHRSTDADHSLLVRTLCEGIVEDTDVDFMIVNKSESCMQEFQLKRFGFDGDDTPEALTTYLNSMAKKYARSRAACLVYLRHFEDIASDLASIASRVDKKTFPFSELLLIGESNRKFVVAALVPEEGFSTYDLADVIL